MPLPADPFEDHHRTAQVLPGGRSVILLHTLPDGASHFDWLLESGQADKAHAKDADPDHHLLVCFRCGSRPDQLAVREEILIERLPAHRRVYLDYEGPIAGDRGHVRRVAQARIVRTDTSKDSPNLHLLLQWDVDPRFATNPCWFRLSPMQDAAPWNRQWKVLCVGQRNVESADAT